MGKINIDEIVLKGELQFLGNERDVINVIIMFISRNSYSYVLNNFSTQSLRHQKLQTVLKTLSLTDTKSELFLALGLNFFSTAKMKESSEKQVYAFNFSVTAVLLRSLKFFCPLNVRPKGRLRENVFSQ